MDGWVVLKIFWAALAFTGAVTVMTWTLRARGLLTWRKRLLAELAVIEHTAQNSVGPQSCGMQVIAAHCRSTLEDISPEVAELKEGPHDPI